MCGLFRYPFFFYFGRRKNERRLPDTGSASFPGSLSGIQLGEKKLFRDLGGRTAPRGQPAATPPSLPSSSPGQEKNDPLLFRVRVEGSTTATRAVTIGGSAWTPKPRRGGYADMVAGSYEILSFDNLWAGPRPRLISESRVSRRFRDH